ncbi:MAG TPA: nitrate reductase molybdenum cofactor assembly chaperone [Actinocatenispora sp.]
MTDRSVHSGASDRLVWQAVALLLAYPDDGTAARCALVRRAVPGTFDPFCDHVAGTPLRVLQQSYVDTFDFRRRCCLHLTYYTDGDTRRRGGSLAALKRTYAAHGMAPADGELPDFLPVMCEFAAAVDAGRDLLVAHRPALELLRLALRDADSPYAAVVAALCATLPGPAPADRAAAVALARSGPPTETVGVYQ